MAEQVKAADAPAPALSFGNFADKVASPSGGFNFKAPEFNTGNQGLFGAPTKFGETADKKEGDKKEDEANPEAQESTAEFTPVVQLDEVDTVWKSNLRPPCHRRDVVPRTASGVELTG